MKSDIWAWIPNEGIGPIKFGSPADEHLQLFKPNSEYDENLGLTTYFVIDKDIRMNVAHGRIVFVFVCHGLYYKGIDLIGKSIREVEAILLTPAIETDSVKYDDGDIQTAHEIDEYGLLLWTIDGKVVSATCSDF